MASTFFFNKFYNFLRVNRYFVPQANTATPLFTKQELVMAEPATPLAQCNPISVNQYMQLAW